MILVGKFEFRIAFLQCRANKNGVTVRVDILIDGITHADLLEPVYFYLSFKIR